MADSFVVRVLKRVLSRSLRDKILYQLWTRIPTRAAIDICRLFRRRKSGSGYANILVVRLDGMGDCVMTLPLLHEFRRCYPASTISVVVAQNWAPLLEAEPSVDRVLPLRWFAPRFLPKSARRLYSCLQLYRRSLWGETYDLVINPRWDADCYLATMLCALTLAPVTVGYEDGTSPWKREENAGFQEAYNVVIEAGPVRQEVLRNLEVLRALGEQPRRIAPSLKLADEQRRWAETWLGETGAGALLVLGLPASAPMRRWSAAHYLDLLLHVETDLKVLVIADAETLPTAQALQAAFPRVRIAMDLPLMSVAALIERCDIYVGGDSGLGHMAAALGRPVIVLSPHPVGADEQHRNSPTRFRPFGENVQVLRPQSRPGCERCCVSSEPHCILDIDPREVAAFIEAELRLQAKASKPGFPEPPNGWNEITVVDPQLAWIQTLPLT